MSLVRTMTSTEAAAHVTRGQTNTMAHANAQQNQTQDRVIAGQIA